MKQLFFWISLIIVFLSCSSDSEMVSEEEANFYALKVNNSWVYKNYKYNSQTEIYDYTGVIDSVSIVGTKIVNGNEYYNFRTLTSGNENNTVIENSNGEHFELLRDSLGYLVNDSGKIKFVNNNFDERILEEYDLVTIFEKLIGNENTITTESGTFSSMYSERYAKDNENIRLEGLDLTYYSKSYGLIFSTTSLINNATPLIERRLDSYNIND